jgi:hypothetical protein
MFLFWIIGFIVITSVVIFVSLLVGEMRGEASWFKSISRGILVYGCIIILVIILSSISNYFTGKMHVSKGDIYGSYVIDRDKFPGRNANWQYERFRFEIIEPDVFKFYKTYDGKIIKTYTGKVEFTLDNRPHIKLHMQYPDGDTCHVLRENPTLYREPFSFYYVFESPLFGNMFFTKGKNEQRQ